MDAISNAFKGDGICDGCSTKFNVFKRKKNCTFCKSLFCSLCLIRRADKKLCCRNCEILTARPLDRSQLLKLKSRDLVNYLSSKHIPTNGCVEKEDLVNTLVRAVNNSTYHSHASGTSRSDHGSRPSTYSYPNSPRQGPLSSDYTHPNRKQTQSYEDLTHLDGIRVQPMHTEESSPDGIRVVPSSVRTQDEENDIEDFEVITAEEAVESNTDVDVNEAVGAAVASDVDITEVTQAEAVVETEVRKPLLLSDISSEADLKSLTVKQLKELLVRNRTDFKGCVERNELLQKASQLWADYINARKDIEKLSIDELCKICMDAPIECVLLECGHMCTCTVCGKQLSECPICRQYVVRCVRTFKA